MSAPKGEAVQPEREWDPSKYVSYSSLTLHRQCPQAWSYRYLRGLSSLRSSGARDLGSWWHMVRALDYLDLGHSLGSLRSAPVEIGTGDEGPKLYRLGDADDKMPGRQYRIGAAGSTIPAKGEVGLALAAAYWKRLSGEDRDWWIEEIGEALPDRLAYMDARWRERWADEREREAPLGVEVKFKRSVTAGEDPAVMPGYIDLVYLDTRRNLTVVRDSKSSKTIAAAEAADDLSDSQLHLYSWGVMELVKAWGVPPVTALSYDRARSAMPKQPSLTQAGSLSKSVTDYDLHTYLVFAAGPDGDGVPFGEPDTYVQSGKRKGEPKFGVYEADAALVEKLSTPAAASVWFQRTLTPLNNNIVRAHINAVRHTQTEAERTVAYFTEHGEAPRNFTRRGCDWCDYKGLCRAELIGGPDGDYPVEQFGLTHTTR